MSLKPDLPSFDPIMEATVLGAIAKELQRLADEARERWRAALARIEGMPLLDPLAEQDAWEGK